MCSRAISFCIDLRLQGQSPHPDQYRMSRQPAFSAPDSPEIVFQAHPMWRPSGSVAEFVDELPRGNDARIPHALKSQQISLVPGHKVVRRAD